MNKFVFITITLFFLTISCKKNGDVITLVDNGQIPISKSYYHFAIGDSLEYNNAHFQVVENSAIIGLQEYYGVSGVVLRDTVWNFYMRLDDSQRVYIHNFSHQATVGYSLLFKMNAAVQENWTTNIFGTLTVFTMESRTDTVVAPVKTFYDCVKIKIQYTPTDYEYQWFAKGYGLVKRNYVGIDSLQFSNLLISKIRLK